MYDIQYIKPDRGPVDIWEAIDKIRCDAERSVGLSEELIYGRSQAPQIDWSIEGAAEHFGHTHCTGACVGCNGKFLKVNHG